MSITQATAEYEEWLGSQVILVPDEIKLKHKKMAEGEFPFLRATFYRWAHLFPKHCPELYAAPRVLGVGDLHIENFGTWRDAEGRLAWGVNDFDESCFLPYTNDLVRLATSAYFALTDKSNPLNLDFKESCRAIQEGYLNRLKQPKPFVLAENNGWLRNVVLKRLADHEKKGEDDLFERFYEKYSTLSGVEGEVPADARMALNSCFPQPTPAFEIKHREAGLGSLGRQRFTAVATNWKGGIVVREAKALAPSAWLWANRGREESSAAALATKRIYFSEIVARSVRSSDPLLKVLDGWSVRRLGPDAFKVEINDLFLKPGEEEELTKKLLEAMGKELGNIHSSSGSPNSILDHLKNMSGDNQSVKWLMNGSMKIVEETREDFRDWKNSVI
ncbi:MAG TPA: DUF2252 family protein [Blastocatellia bacterium]|nr:DUF2252 family protein [Blastocatellia bacterium]